MVSRFLGKVYFAPILIFHKGILNFWFDFNSKEIGFSSELFWLHMTKVHDHIAFNISKEKYKFELNRNDQTKVFNSSDEQ